MADKNKDKLAEQDNAEQETPAADTQNESQQAPETPKAAAEDAEKRVSLRLPRMPGKGTMFVAVNGRSFLIKRGVSVEVPQYVADFVHQQEEQDEKTAAMIDELSSEAE